MEMTKMHTKVNWPNLETKTECSGILKRYLNQNELSWKTSLENFPIVIEPASKTKSISTVELFTLNREWILQQLIEYGAILFRDFDVDSKEQFENLLVSLGLNLSSTYPFGTSSRTKISGNVFNASYIDRRFIIQPHTEMAYLQTRPRWISFYCDTEPTKYGETSCFDTHKVYQFLPEYLRQRFSKTDIKYMRPMNSKKDFIGGRTIQEVFGTLDVDTIEKSCKEWNVKFKWLDNNFIEAETETPIVVVHPVTGKPCLNANFLLPEGHLYQLKTFRNRYSFLTKWLLTLVFKQYKKKKMLNFITPVLPDGNQLTDEDVRLIYSIFYENSTIFSWQKGDILLLDNIRSAHGRLNFSGERKIMTCFGDIYDVRQVQTSV